MLTLDKASLFSRGRRVFLKLIVGMRALASLELFYHGCVSDSNSNFCSIAKEWKGEHCKKLSSVPNTYTRSHLSKHAVPVIPDAEESQHFAIKLYELFELVK